MRAEQIIEHGMSIVTEDEFRFPDEPVDNILEYRVWKVDNQYDGCVDDCLAEIRLKAEKETAKEELSEPWIDPAGGIHNELPGEFYDPTSIYE